MKCQQLLTASRKADDAETFTQYGQHGLLDGRCIAEAWLCDEALPETVVEKVKIVCVGQQMWLSQVEFTSQMGLEIFELDVPSSTAVENLSFELWGTF